MKHKIVRLENDGERMIPRYHKNNLIYGEHLGRYLAVKEIIKDKQVLDIASGSGYGTKLLAENAKSVYGIDIDKASIEYAQQNYAAKNVTYKVGSGTSIPLAAGSVDAVISMETIEHIQDQELFLHEIKRVLRPDGFLVVSTPNDVVYPKGNHFHVREHNKRSLTALLKKQFKHVRLCYEIVATVAAVVHEDDLSKEGLVEWPLLKEYSSETDNSIYYLAICSDENPPDVSNVVVMAQEFSYMKQRELTDQIGSLLTEVNNLRINYEHELSEAKRLTIENQRLQKELTKRSPYLLLKVKSRGLRSRLQRRNTAKDK